MKNKKLANQNELDNVIFSLNKKFQNLNIIDANQFLSKNKEAIILGLDNSKTYYKKRIQIKLTIACSFIIMLILLFTFSYEARAFVNNILYKITEWFDIDKGKSGILFEINNNSIYNMEPKSSETKKETDRIWFSNIKEAKEKYNKRIFILNNSDFHFENGYIQNETICLNYKINKAKIQIIEEPIQQEGSINVHFNDSNFEKCNTNIGILYYEFKNGILFGCMFSNNTTLIISAECLTNDQFNSVINSIE